MAFVSKDDKARLAPGIKAVLKKYNMKGTIAVRHHSTLVVNIKSGELDVLGAWKTAALNSNKIDMYNKYDVERLNYVLAENHMTVNTYWIDDDFADKKVVNFLNELKEAMEGDQFFNEDDPMTDYFHRSHYTDINIGSWTKPYECTSETKTFAPVECLEVAA